MPHKTGNLSSRRARDNRIDEEALVDLFVHKQKWEKCTNCSLSKDRNAVVLYRGQIPSELVWVGESPRALEEEVGQPFVGYSGDLLDYIMRKVCSQAHREVRYSVTNLVACKSHQIFFQEDCKISCVCSPNHSQISSCFARLDEYLEICRPRVVVRVGDISMRTILPNYPDILIDFADFHRLFPVFASQSSSEIIADERTRDILYDLIARILAGLNKRGNK